MLQLISDKDYTTPEDLVQECVKTVIIHKRTDK